MEYGEDMPEECLKCGALDSFLKMPEEILKVREQEMAEDELVESKTKKAKISKPKLTKPKKKKRK
jgi:hypothetical protein